MFAGQPQGLSVNYSSKKGIIFDAQSLPYGGPYFSPTKIGLMVLSFTISGIIAGSVTSFIIMKSISNKVKPRIDLYMRIFLIIGFFGLLAIALMTILNVTAYFWVFYE